MFLRLLGLVRRPCVSYGLGSDGRTPATPITCFPLAVLDSAATLGVLAFTAATAPVLGIPSQTTQVADCNATAAVASVSLTMAVASDFLPDEPASPAVEVTVAGAAIASEVATPLASLDVADTKLQLSVVTDPAADTTAIGDLDITSPLEC